ncbi:serine hydrolase domain-containing protein [Umezawaea sp. Da 62-37]|uniref:serine hydrolase domain-containing protein n=1 Tax=Umezawaea sp. Da 62-37 TaxID=3075927 RepID=UPI0028F6D2FA|nr:serine hydrolase domain-containing protein [Umezawaea sp. Da 62-37]WNV85596.1 serine hydrolase domain-containing protein [Umezawaea sp. Da 62-37]
MPDFTRTTHAFHDLLDRSGGGASLVVHHDGEVAVDLHGGSDAHDRPWTADTLVMCQSTTKGVMATAVHALVDDGLLDVDAPVARYWPEFARAGKAGVLVRHVLGHSAGLQKMRKRTASLDEVFDYDHQVRALEAQAPAYEPGSANGYHALTYGWLTGELVRRASGRPIARYVTDALGVPLGVEDGLFIGCPPERRHRVAPTRFRFGPLPTGTLPARSKELTRDPRAMDVPVPAIGGFFTARALAAVYAMLAGGGTLNGRGILDRAVVERATTVQSTRRDGTLHLAMDWRLGYHGMRARGAGMVPGAFGHTGFGGSAAWADPSRGLAAAFTCDTSRSPLDRRVPTIFAALIADLDR